MFVIKQSSVLHSQPKSTVGTPAYVAPEVLSRKKYNGKALHFTIPDYVRISSECKHLLSHIFVADPDKRITVQEIEKHPWFLKNLLPGNSEGKCNGDKTGVEQEEEEEERFRQSVDEIVKIIEEA
ncbi:unnamed protein product [Brassica rapa]|uniref:Protein kinase domain-containing protein n=2 Tax=Brassica TaxID=3705 RepID=A0A8D9LSQ4_BRACM|nr:unnamed protein product [Brassica napus]CAG7885428.1 unnamed protein product [Brassica rapa]